MGNGREVRPAGGRVPVTLVQTFVLIPSVEGCRPQAAGWFPRRSGREK
ncbi:MAG: hypothetical protein LBM98_10725 [Oscillospiraceae bacterium]|nr:hypothetical protein [Oscillospiraceae bacterium]